jgi:hypothetical protein
MHSIRKHTGTCVVRSVWYFSQAENHSGYDFVGIRNHSAMSFVFALFPAVPCYSVKLERECRQSE